MKSSRKKISIVHEFIAIGGFFSVTVATLCAWFIFQTVGSNKNKIIHEMECQAERLEKSFSDSIERTIYMMQVLISQIRHNHNDIHALENLLMRFRLHSQVESILTWTAFSWVDKNNKMIVDMLHGILKKPLDMSHRDYLHFTKKKPGQIYFGKPAYGSTSNAWMIPAGIGVTNCNNHYIGSIVIGFNISALLEKFKITAAREDIDFALVDQNFRVIFQSKDNLINVDERGVISLPSLTKTLETIDFSSEKSHRLSKIVYKKGGENYCLHKISKHPFLIYSTYNKNILSENLWRGLLFRLIEITIVGLTVFLLLFLLYKQIVSPLVILSKIVDEIPKGLYKTKAPRSWTYEITNLTKQTLNLKRILSREKREKKDLIEEVEIVNTSTTAKEDFSRQIMESSLEPLKMICYSIEVLISNHFGDFKKTLSFNEQLLLLQEIHKASFKILEKTDEFLNLELVNILDLLNECVTINARTAHKHRTPICLKVTDRIPHWHVDKFKFKQIIVALLKRSLDFSPRNSSIEIFVNLLKRAKEKAWLCIIIKDNGFGLDNDDRKKISDNLNSKGTDYEHLGTEVIKKLVHLHSGEIYITDTKGAGSVVRLLFPYFNQAKKALEEVKLPSNVVRLFNKN